MPTFHIHLEGLVQGIGFRPFVYQLATSRGLKGMVSNDADGVHIRLSCEKETAEKFLKSVLQSPPPLSKIHHWTFEEEPPVIFKDFSIQKEDVVAVPKLHITPDLGVCPACKSEIREEADRRYAYGFNTCIHCGPRYSIMHQLPYDREHTVMDGFTMCPTCQQEYNDPLTRRHYSQTNSCPDCGIQLTFLKKDGSNWEAIQLEQSAFIQYSADLIEAGAILAIKGIGGYLLVCDATNEAAVKTLRKRKNRPDKPFAVMFPDEKSLGKYAVVDSASLKAFSSIESPIVLHKIKHYDDLAWEAISPGLDTVGAMQAYTPLFVLLLDILQKPIVATSGNTSGAPICFDDQKVIEDLGALVDGILMHNRTILAPQDDSVIRFASHSKKRIMLRRSRGYAPSLFNKSFSECKDNSLLAMGADLKSAFGLLHNENIYISQFLGNLESYDSQTSFQQSLHHLSGLLNARPGKILIDKHPAYFSHQLGKTLAKKYNVSYSEIQHHEAHFAAVLGENNLLDTDESVLGVVWDGTGWGKDDSHILGSESFIFHNGEISHLTSLASYPLLLGDKMAKEPRLSALALFNHYNEALPFIENHFSKREWNLYRKMLDRGTAFSTSSMGRLFDAVACLIGITTHNGYEGEAAIKLELAAQKAYQCALEVALPEGPINLKTILDYLLDLRLKDKPKAIIALAFHQILVEWICQIARKAKVNQIAFSGGVFQNALLVDLINNRLSEEYKLFFHNELSPNDECIAFGQLCHNYISQKAPGAKGVLKGNINEAICV